MLGRGVKKMIAYYTREQIAALLRSWRKQKNFSAQEVSDKLKMYGIEITKTTIFGYENCVSSPTIPTFLALCRIYDVEDEIVEVDDKPRALVLNEKERLLLDYFRQATSDTQGLVLKMLKPEKEDTALSVG